MDDELTILLKVKQGPYESTIFVTNIPNWYELFGIFTLYCIAAMTVFYAGLWIASRYMSPGKS